MSTFQIFLRLGAFMLLALPVVQCQGGKSTPPSAVKKAASAPADKADVAKKKAADEVAKKAATDEAAKKAAADEAAKKAADAAKAATVVKLENARLDAVDSDYASMSLHDCVPGKPDPIKIVCDGKDSKAYHVKVNDKDLRAHLKQFHVGDHLRVDINGNNELQDLRGPWSVPTDDIPNEISPTCRFLVLTVCALVILGLATLATRGAPLKFIVGLDNRYSNSKFQIAVWFWVLLTTYMATVVFRLWYAGWDFFGGVSIPQNLLVLSGLSAITFGGAKAITTSKVNAAMSKTTQASTNGAAVPPGNQTPNNPPNQSVGGGAGANADPTNASLANTNQPNPGTPNVANTPVAPNAPAAGPLNFAFSGASVPPGLQFSGTGSIVNPKDPKNSKKPGDENFFNDLVQDDFEHFDFGDFQMLMVTLVAVVMYGTLIFHFLATVEFLKTASLPDVDTTILAGFGLGHGAYLAKKAGGDAGKS
jgi:hypothetical protein